MPIARFEMPDGRIGRFEVPEGTTPEQAQVLIQQSLSNVEQKQQPPISSSGIEQEFGQTGGGAATGRPMRNVKLNVQEQPRPLESALIGATKSAVVDPILGISKLLTGGNIGQEASQQYAKEAEPYKKAYPAMYATGNVLGSLAPGMGVLKGAQAVPSLATPLAQNVATGTVLGALSPEETNKTGVEFYKKQGAEALLGGATGTIPTGVEKLASFLRGRPQTPEMANAINQAREAGYVIPPTSANQSGLNRAIEGISGKIATEQNASLRNQEITNKLAAKSLGLPEETPITTDILDKVRNVAGKAYEAVANLPIKPAVKGEPLMNIPGVPEVNPKQMVYDLRVARQEADAYYKAYGRSADPEQLLRAKQAKATANNIENNLEDYAKSIGREDLLPELRNARQLIAKTYTIENAANTITGTVDARKLAAALEKGKPLSDELKTAAEFSARFPKATQLPERIGSTPQFNPADFYTGVVGTAVTGNALPMAATSGRPLLRHIALSAPIQNRLIQQSGTPQSDLARLLMIQPVRKLGE